MFSNEPEGGGPTLFGDEVDRDGAPGSDDDDDERKPVPGEHDDNDELDVAQMNRKVWLVKVPTFVAKKWASVGDDGAELGRVRIHSDSSTPGSSTPKMTLHMPDAAWAADVPQTYNLTHTSQPVNSYIFTESPDTAKAVNIAGTVKKQATVLPVVDEDYRMIMKARTKATSAANSKRVVKMMDVKELRSSDWMAGSGGATGGGFASLSKKRSSSEKKERMPRDDLLNVLFKCFKEYRYWTLKGLTDRTKQPQAWLKEVLLDASILNKRGPYNGMYELKPEFRDPPPQMPGANAAAAGAQDVKMEDAGEEEGDEEEEEMI
ncbi:transcription initiation factor IIF, beta subunit-domain-containing protein [Blyttiomyces helicus]|uniref:Transcription initiation factor IIF subunit beta n=1 Tax=Blyttiomyces helicus TaxID=388810 RepID=A0A4P9WN08_9FUNG|nr:transcription initiation factor IIF, beta subunit-domain-containing protein [Blyttiomyces helicus]|eukprot:RKO92136.1 transcription initiation factor IIF, beta subunit-domain-containing protein [Blyttiomyces helicus]